MPDKESTQELPTTPKPGHVDVFDLDGVRHNLSRLNAHDVVTHLKWCYADKANEAIVRRQKVVVLVSKKDAQQTAANPANAEKVDLATLDDDSLKAFAKEHFQMDFAPTVSRDDVMQALLSER